MERPSKKATRWIQFIGGRNLIFTLSAGVLLGALIFVFYLVRFIFEPIGIILGTIFAPVLISMIFYFLLEPIVNYFERKGVKRIYSIISIALILLLLVGTIGVWAVPKIYDQTASLVYDFPNHVSNLEDTVQGFFTGTMLEEPIQDIFGSIEDVVRQIIATVSESLGDIQSFVGNIFSTISGFFVILFTAPIITFFLLKDARRFRRYFLKMMPPKFRDDASELGEIFNTQVGNYLKGQFIVALANGLIVFVGFLIIGMPYAMPLAILVTITSVIPYIGPFIAFIPCAIIALLTSFQMLIGLIIVWIIEQVLNGNIIEPKVLGEQLRVHPVTIVLVLLVMGNLFGLFGLVFGIPTYAVFKAIGVFLFRKFKQRYNHFYGDDDGEYEDTEFSHDEYIND